MTPIERRTHQNAILAHVADAGSLADLASILIKYIYYHSGDCYFEPVKNSPHEWVLAPQNWVGIYMSKGRSRMGGKVILSLNDYPGNLEGATTLAVKKGRNPSWSKVTLKFSYEIKDAVEILDIVRARCGIK